MYLPYDIGKEGHDDYDFDEVEQYGGDVFLIAEPKLNAFINVTRFCRIGGGISYRFIQDLDGRDGSDRISNELLSGPGAHIAVHFGWF